MVAVKEICERINMEQSWKAELDEGKMLGVLVVKDPNGDVGYLVAFSGTLCGKNDFEYFIPAVYDYLNPTGFFKTEESEISQINKRIDIIESSLELRELQNQMAEFEKEANERLNQVRKIALSNKTKRDLLRTNPNLTVDEKEAIERESQFDKANLKRLKKALELKRLQINKSIDEINERVESLKHERKRRSAELQTWLFEKFRLLNACGDSRNMLEIFKYTKQGFPPAGAGECAAPKLLQYAYLNKLQPLCMAEFWWGKSPTNEIRNHGHYYPSCQHKCYPILNFMLQGLNVEENPLSKEVERIEVLYEDEYLIAINKPAGLLSSPGKVHDDCVEKQLCDIISEDEDLKVVHRLDQNTSGVMLVAKGMLAFQLMQRLFAERKLEKTYIAILSGVPKQLEGRINVPISSSYEHRPMQVVDLETGKSAVTDFKVLETRGNECKVEFKPYTGRTHQIRVHAASKFGLNIPIKGDMLYGTASDRLYLHSQSIKFKHPFTHQIITIESKVPF